MSLLQNLFIERQTASNHNSIAVQLVFFDFGFKIIQQKTCITNLVQRRLYITYRKF